MSDCGPPTPVETTDNHKKYHHYFVKLLYTQVTELQVFELSGIILLVRQNKTRYNNKTYHLSLIHIQMHPYYVSKQNDFD